jgi:hypothetical protein
METTDKKYNPPRRKAQNESERHLIEVELSQYQGESAGSPK